MPIIPKYERERMLPTAPAPPMADIKHAAPLSDTLSALSKEVVDIIIERQKQLQQHDDALSLVRLENEVSEAKRKLKETYAVEAGKYRSVEDLSRYSDEASNQYKAIIAELSSTLPKRIEPQAQRIAKTYQNRFLDYTATYQANARKEITGEVVKNTIRAAELEARDGEWGSLAAYIQKIDVLQSSGVLTAVQANETKTIGQQRIAESYIDGMVVREPIKAAEYIKKNELNKYLTPEKYKYYQNKAETLGRQEQEKQAQEVVLAVLQSKYTKPDGSIDANGAVREVLNSQSFTDIPGLTLNGRNNVSYILKEINTTQEQEKRRRQEANIEGLYSLAVKSPSQALAKARTMSDNDVDKKELATFTRSTESHIMNLALVSRQERELAKRAEGEAFTKVILDIQEGKLATKSDVTAAVMSIGVPDSTNLIKEAQTALEKKINSYGKVDWFKAATDDWKAFVSSAPSKSDKQRLLSRLPDIQGSLLDYARANKIETTDPAIFEEYTRMKKNLTMSSWGRFMQKLSGMSASSPDSSVLETPDGMFTGELPDIKPQTILRDRNTGRMFRTDGTKVEEVQQ